MTRTRYHLLSALAWLLLGAAAQAQELPATTYRLKALAFTGLTVPHQQISDYNPAPPLGIGFEVFYTPRLSLSLDATASWHGGGPSGLRELRLSSLQLLGRWHFPHRYFNPFLQAGVGGYQARLEGSGDTQELAAAGVSVGAGAEQDLADRWALQLDARTHIVHGSQDNGGEDRWIGHSQLLVWLIYRLP